MLSLKPCQASRPPDRPFLTDIEALPKGVLFWRSLTQWQGGIGMIVFTVALMPILGGGATQMFNAETPGDHTSGFARV